MRDGLSQAVRRALCKTLLGGLRNDRGVVDVTTAAQYVSRSHARGRDEAGKVAGICAGEQRQLCAQDFERIGGRAPCRVVAWAGMISRISQIPECPCIWAVTSSVDAAVSAVRTRLHL